MSLISQFLDIKRTRGSAVYRIGINHHHALGAFPRLAHISFTHSNMEVENKMLQARLLSHPFTRELPKIDIAVIGTHEEYFVYEFGRLFRENVPMIAYPKKLKEQFGYAFLPEYFEEMYDDEEYVIQKRIVFFDA